MADAPSNTDRRPSSPRGKASSEASGYAGVFQAHRQSPILGSVQSAPEARALSSASITRPQRSYGPLRLPSDPPPLRRGAASPGRDGSPPMTRITLPTCRAPYPGGSRRVPVSIASPLTRPSPFPRRVGIRIFTFEACSGFTRVTARWIAQPPKAAFVTRLQPALPDQTARQLPEQSTTLRVEPSSTGDTRRRGARRVEDGRGGLGHTATLRFPSPLIKPDVRISRIRLSDWFHRAAHGGAPSSVCVAEAVGDGRRAQQHRSASVFAAG